MSPFDAPAYIRARENNEGYCTVCQDWTRDCTEPDAESYDCPQCEQHTVIGADLYLIERT